MVDSGPAQPDSVIDFNSRRKGNGQDGAARAPSLPPAPQWHFPLSLPFLMERLGDRHDQVGMWAAFQLLHRWEPEAERYLERMWESGLPEIRESAINLVAKQRIHQYSFPLLRVFNSNEGGLRAAAGLALGRLEYRPAAKPLESWFNGIYRSPDANLDNLQAAAKALLMVDNRRYWEEIHGLLVECHNNHALYSVLFSALAAHAEDAEQVRRLARSYKEPREIFHDVYLCQHLVEMVGRPNISRYLQSRMNGRYSLSAAYQEALQILGVDVAAEDVRMLLEELTGCTRSPSGLQRFLPLAEALIDLLAPDEPESAVIKAFLSGCCWVKIWDEATLKVREMEYHMLVSLPLVAMVHRAERECMADPAGQALRIIQIYRSPLLSPQFMTHVLNLLSSTEGEPVAKGLRSGPLSGWLRDEEKDALWKLMTRQVEGVDYPFEQILPEPWLYANEDVMARLTDVLQERFSEYLVTGRGQAVDYCLEVFMRQADEDLLELLLRHFDTLINHHYDSFVGVMTHLPDGRLLAPLLRHYREGEFEMDRLVRFICDVHKVPHPESLPKTPEKPQQSKLPATVRLICLSCAQSYQYVLEALYVDEDRIEQRQIPSPEDLWVPEPYKCKNCNVEVPFEPEPAFLAELYSELLAARILHLTNREESGLHHIHHVHLIPFPALEGKTRHPDKFLEEVEQLIEACGTESGRLPYRIEQGKFFLEIGNLERARQAFQTIQAGPVKCPIAPYYLGIIAFQEKNPYEARVNFSRLVATCHREEFENELDNPVDMAHHYLKLLDKREFKRSHFRLIST